jgi:cbb3-type cytochrome oxidase subunit 3
MDILSMIITILIATGLLPVIIIIGVLIAVIYWVISPSSSGNIKKKTKYIIIGAGEAPYQLVEQISKK